MPATALSLGPPGNWVADAKCGGYGEVMDIDLKDPSAEARARSVCHVCPVLRACRRWVLSLPTSADVAGVCAGMTPEERTRARRGNRRRRT